MNNRANPRRPAPIENHRTYSSAARSGIPAHPSHEGVIQKSHPVQNQVQAVVLNQQPNMASQVSNVNPGGPQMANPVVANAGNNQMSVLPQGVMNTGSRFPTFHQQQHHQPRPQHPQQRPTLLPSNQRTHNSVPNNAVPHNAVHQTANMPQHYFVAQNIPQMHFNPNQFINAQHMNAVNYSQSRAMPVQSGYFPTFTLQPSQQQQYAPPASYQNYTMPTAVYQTYQPHHQQTAQMMAPVHQTRGPQVSNQAVMQTQQNQIVQMSAPTNTEVSEPPPVQPKAPPKRVKKTAILSDPDSGQVVNLEEYAKEDVKPKPINRTNESFSGASNQSNALSASSPKPSSTDVNSIGLEFATKVAVAATEPITRFHTNPNVSESDVTVNTNSSLRPETEESVAISKTPSSELNSETNVTINSDICDNSTDDNNLVIHINSTNSASNSSGSQTDSKQLNKSLAQNSNKNVTQINSTEEINENGDITDSCNESVKEKEETTQIDYTTQKINNNINLNNNNNNRKKDMFLKEESIKKSEDLEDNKVETITDETDSSVALIDKIEPQLTSDISSPVINSNLSTESADKTTKNDIIFNNLNENHLEKDDNEDNRIIDIKNKEVSGEPTEIESVISSAKLILPDLPYNDDQWTPLNPDGKKVYGRDFLLAISKTETLKMPENLRTDKKLNEIIRKESSSHGFNNEEPSGSNLLFLPNFAGANFRNRLMPAQINRRQSQPGRHQEKQRKIISTSLTQDVKLHTTDNAWKPTKLVATTDDPIEKETQDLLKKFRGILNKLTPQKYEDLLKKTKNLKIDTEDRLKRVLDLVFEKAVDEQAFCIQYANLCKQLSLCFKVMAIKGPENTVEEVKFHKLLITKCQKEFETEIYASITDLKEREEEIDNCADPQKKKMLTEILDEDKRRARKRSLGNIKLIGELYKLNMLKGNIMVQCIDGLIKEGDDESLECLCALFKTIGQQIEADATPEVEKNVMLDRFFNKMDAIAEQKDPNVKGTSARVRFMLRDVIDMRLNGWKARRDENLPKRIDEIHNEIQKEDEQKARELHQHTINRKQKGGRMGNDSSDGNQWTTVSARKSQNASQPNVDWNILKQQSQQNHETVQLGPQSGSGTLWGLGSRGGAQTSQSRFQTDDKGINRFSALDGTDAQKSSQKSIPSRDSSKGRSNQQHSYQSSRSQRSQRDRDRDDAINLARNFSSQRQSPSESSPMYPNMSRNSSRSGSREASAPNSRNSSMRRETPELDVNQLRGTNISETDLENRSKTSLLEYMSVNSLTEPVIDVTSLCNESNVHTYVYTALNLCLETNSSQLQRFAIGKLIDHFLSRNIIRTEHFFKGLNQILEVAEDIVIDVPKMWTYIGEVLAPIFINLPQNRKKFILEMCKMCAENKRSIFVANIFTGVSNFTSVEKANELWVNSDLNWNEFLSSEQNIEDFVKKNSVEFTLRLTNKSSNFDQNYNSFRKEVEALVKQKKTNDEIQNYISKIFNASQTSDHKFTSALFTGVIKGCINAPIDTRDTFNCSLDTNHFQACGPLLGKFLGGDPEIELQALIALQELIDELQHPSGLLMKLFQVLYEEAIISQEAFFQWEKTDNSRPGKAVAVKSVTSFFTWLAENQEDDDDNDS